MTVSCLPAPLTAGLLPVPPPVPRSRAGHADTRNLQSPPHNRLPITRRHPPSAHSFLPFFLALYSLSRCHFSSLPANCSRLAHRAQTHTHTRANRGAGRDGDFIVLAPHTVCVFVVIVERSQKKGEREKDGEAHEEVEKVMEGRKRWVVRSSCPNYCWQNRRWLHQSGHRLIAILLSASSSCSQHSSSGFTSACCCSCTSCSGERSLFMVQTWTGCEMACDWQVAVGDAPAQSSAGPSVGVAGAKTEVQTATLTRVDSPANPPSTVCSGSLSGCQFPGLGRFCSG